MSVFMLRINMVTEHNIGKTKWICLAYVIQMIVSG